ncbi:NAD(P)-dependent alcohol dehydrogenase [Pseudonocardia humida]|uniref:NAD(P)-dependent alcohol dehydrogenase n=1 Tax=Pseudonocardia humida TaxID=2800819 RepID=A0ABT1A1H7_9PSEU|nr:NAD(P)-dependent alcohol dehydrogenase [Pseudonocardia humida]MCO1656860.1 NAD(P)-dependent alcohol dehydrogenase [Pseudonocardia humida]
MSEKPAGPPATMAAIVHHRYGPPEVLRFERLPRPVPAGGEVLIRNHAITVSSSDCAFRAADPFFARVATGLIRPRRPVLGVEVAGEVAAVGEGVTGFGPGDRVVAVAGVAMGGHAEYTRLPAEAVVPIPGSLAFVDAVAVVEGGLTALPFLRDHAKVGPGQRVLVNGASGAVGTAAVQLAKHLGADVTGVCSTANLDLVRSLGATEAIDYTRTDFTGRREAYDVVFDAVGKSSFRRCRPALRPGGTYLTTVPGLPVMLQALWTRRFGSHTAVLAFTGLRSARDKAHDTALLLALADAEEIRPVVDRRWPLAQAADAHRHVGSGRKRGVVVLTVDE